MGKGHPVLVLRLCLGRTFGKRQRQLPKQMVGKKITWVRTNAQTQIIEEPQLQKESFQIWLEKL